MIGPRSLHYVTLQAGLEALSLSGLARWATPRAGGLGAILTVHHVRPARPGGFRPNRILEITPEFLDKLLARLARTGVEFVSLEEAGRRLAAGTGRRFVCLTFDDGYRDNVVYARPILTRYGAPWTLFVTTDFAEQRGELWWLALEAAIGRAVRLDIDLGRGRQSFDCRTAKAKWRSWSAIYWRLRALDEAALRAAVRDLAAQVGIEMAPFCRELCLDWDELAALKDDPLVSIGAHSVTHARLAKLPLAEAEAEMRTSRDLIEARLGVRPTAFAYPVGDRGSAAEREFMLARALGYRMAVTTRPGVLRAADAQHPHSLPRLSLNGLFQRPRYIEALLSGLPFLPLRASRSAGRASASSE
ncbi:MAG: polysaccharide deacetylase family protein [Xanthobacteraceae bacterium]